jgi:class 3 adenylate cyclase
MLWPLSWLSFHMLNFLKSIGISPEDSQELRLKKYTLLIITLSCCVAAPIWSYSYYLMGLRLSALIPFAYILVLAPAIAVFARTKNEKALLNVQLFAIFLCPVIMQWLAGGLLKGGVIILWSFLSPLTALVFLNVRKAKLWMSLVVGSIIVTGIFNSYFEQYGMYIDRSQKLLLNMMNVAGACLVIYFAIQYFVNTIRKNNQLLEEEKQKADKLLLNILPLQVAEELKKSGKTRPTLYKGSTIIFTDFKDFTQFSELFTPDELINELDTCFEKFDEIIGNNGLEKIKTMGDAYICVAGILRNEADAASNAIKAVTAALSMAEYIRRKKEQKLKEGKVYWDVRIGVHTGDVVAGIVGKNKFAFDIWGDAVNTASRLETCSEPGKVNISNTTYRLVKEHFECSYRGKLPVKNKGELDMYFVEQIVSAVLI